MREVVFRRQNKDKWREYELLLAKKNNLSSDTIADMYVEVTNDLSYAITYYPKSHTRNYLNLLAIELHQVIYKNKKEKASRFVQFWKYEVPLVVRSNHIYFLYAAIAFIVFCLIGAYTQSINPDFARSILGDYYVEMTLDNIEKGDPMAVYKDEHPFLMFFRIFLNNMKVGFYTVIAGIIPFLGTTYILLQNGIMVGSFLYFFEQHHVMKEAFSTVFIHGTVELTMIAIEGAAGFIISKSILFPGTYTRVHSFMKGVKDAIKISIGVVPFTLLAAFFEGYVTRYTSMPQWLTVAIIGGSFLLMVYYYIIYPFRLDNQLEHDLRNPILEVKDL